MNLSELIQARMAAMGWTMSDVARRGKMPVATVHKLIRDAQLKQSPRPDTLDRLAEGLELDLMFVRMAAAVAAGLIADDDAARQFVFELIVRTPSEHVDAVLEHLLAKLDAILEAEDAR